jgi:hypothetical protein
VTLDANGTNSEAPRSRGKARASAAGTHARKGNVTRPGVARAHPPPTRALRYRCAFRGKRDPCA